MDKELALAILRHSFPQADNIRIIHDEIEDGQRHVTSDVIHFTVEYEEDHKTRRSHVVMKAPRTANKVALELCEKFNFANTEICVYKKMLPQINRYMDQSLAPTYFYTTDSKILVLEDLTARGYTSGEKLPLLNNSDARGTLRVLAHFHAASHKLHTEDPDIPRNLLNTYMDGFDLGRILNQWASIVLELLRRKNETGLICKMEAAMAFFQKDSDKIQSLLNKSNFKFVVLNHGDCRKDNFLYKHSANNEVQIMFVDYQCSFWSTPAVDLIYFLTTSVLPSVLEEHFDDLIDEYLCDLNMRLKKLDCSSTYQRADFDQDFLTLKFFLLYSFFTLCGLTSPLNSQELIDAYSLSETDFNRVRDSCLNDERFVHIIHSWLKYFDKSKISDQFLSN